MRLRVWGAAALLFLPLFVAAADVVDVFVSIPPQKFFVRQIAGPHAVVHSMVPNGVRPDTFEPSVADVQRLAHADLFFLIGVPYEQTWTRIFREHFPELRLVDCCPGLVPIEDVHAEHGYAGERDPHIWTSPRQAIHFARVVHQALVARYPHATQSFTDKLADLEHQLVKLDESIQERFESLDTRLLVVAHPSLSYLARDYGLRQVSLEEYGREIRLAKLLKLIELAQRESVRQIYVQPQFSRSAAETLARETGARVVTVDPLAEDYLKNMERIIRLVERQ